MEAGQRNLADIHKVEVVESIDLLKASTALELPGPYLRNLSILDLPDELLLRICDEVLEVPIVEPGDSDYGSKRRQYRSGNALHTLKNLRLTCRRFCEMCSELLVTDLDVDISRAGLTRLEDVAYHPTIRNGVRCVTLHIDTLNPDYANNLFAFARLVIDHSARRLSSLPEDDHHKSLVEDSEAMEVAAGGLASQDPNVGQRRYRTLIQAAYKQLHHAFEMQRRLLSTPSFVERVSAAIAAMPRARRVELKESLRQPRIFQLEQLYTLEADWRITPQESLFNQSIASSLTTGSPNASYLLPCLTITLPVELLTALHSDGVSLAALTLDFTSPRRLQTLPPSPAQASQMRALVSDLRVFEFRQFLGNSPTSTRVMLRPLLDPLVDTDSLCSIDVQRLQTVYSRFDADELAGMALGALTTIRPWPRLSHISLDGLQFHESELKKILDGIPRTQSSHISLYRVRLMIGTWATVLDLLRGWRGESGGVASLRECVGAECHFMSREKLSRTFGVWNEHGFQKNEAELFVCGMTDVNPVTS
ncbi:hypothetical protein R3P38DRAFT_2926365 [Favolaschia claudopus]|uniref:F-box domain-containing protein n=1 Tax=Favolaschia claudopus TaxID=2862362 RepID=A0AAW0BZ17_9AGAR